METESPYFLPSEIARLVLGYLEDEGYSTTCKSFMKECIHLQEYLALLKRGRQYPLTINGYTLIQMIEKFAQFYLVDTNRQTQGLGSLWSQLESVTACLKRQSSLKNFRVEGKSQNSRTRRANVMARLEIDETGDNRIQSGAGYQRLHGSIENIKNLENSETPSTSTTGKKYSGKAFSSPAKDVNSAQKESSSQKILFLESPKTLIHNRSTVKTVKTLKLLAPKRKENDVANCDSPNISKSSVTSKDIDSETSVQMPYKHDNITATEGREETEKMDNEKGFHDNSEMDCSTHLSPSPALRNEDVNDKSGDSAKLSVCDKNVRENLTENVCNGRGNLSQVNCDVMENLTVNNIPMSCQVISSDTDVLTLENGSVLMSKQSVSVNIALSSEEKTVQTSLGTENLNQSESAEQICITKDGSQEHNSMHGHKPAASEINDQASQLVNSAHPISSENPCLLLLPNGNLGPLPTTNEIPSGLPDVVMPSTPKKDGSKATSILKTPVKNLREFGLRGHGKSPRRKRPPKRKSQGEKATERRSSLPNHLNDSSNSNEGSLHENSFPTQLIEQLLNNPLLHERLAENINKTINCSDLSKSQNLSNISAEQDTSQKSGPTTPKPSTSLEDILDPHETKMTEDQINDIIELTKQENVFDSLFQLFNHEAPKDTSSSVATLHVTENTQEGKRLEIRNQTDTGGDFSTTNGGDKTTADHFAPTFPSVIAPHIKEKSFENKYVTEESINAVLNFYPSQGRTLHTPTDFSSLSSFVTLTSTSSASTPTITISTSSNSVPLAASTSVTSTIHSGSVVSFQESSSHLLQQDSITTVTSSNICAYLQNSHVSKESFVPRTLSRDEVDTAASNISGKPMDTSAEVPNVSSASLRNVNQISSVGTSQSQSLPVSAGSNKVSKSTPYLTFVRGVTLSDNSSTPVGQRSSPLTVQMEDDPDTFGGLPSEVKQLYSSFETDLAINEENKESSKVDLKSLPKRKSKKTQEKSPTNEKVTSSKKGLRKSTKSENAVQHPERDLTDTVAVAMQTNNEGCEVSTTGSTSSRKSSSGKTKSKKSPPASKAKKSTPRPLLRCDPLQPRSDNKKGVATPTSKTDTVNKWSSGLSALIKVASPDKEKSSDSGSTVTPKAKKKGSRSTGTPRTPKTPKTRDTVDVSSFQTPTGRIKSSQSTTPRSGHVQENVLPNSLTSQGTPSSLPASSNQKNKKSSSTMKGKKNKNEAIPVRQVPVDNSEPGIIRLGPSCLGIVVKVNNQAGSIPERELMIPMVQPKSPKKSSPNQRKILPKPSTNGTSQETPELTNKDDVNHLVGASLTGNNSSQSERNSAEVSSVSQNEAPILSMPLLDVGSSEDFILHQPNITTPVIEPHAEHLSSQNNINSPCSTTENNLSAQSTPARSKYDEIEYSESRDFLESPSKSKSKMHFRIQSGSLIRDAFHVACSSIENTLHVSNVNTDPPSNVNCESANRKSDEGITVNKMYVATPLHDLVASQAVEIKPLDFGPIDSGLSKSKRAENQKPKQNFRLAVKIKRGLTKNPNSSKKPPVIELLGSDSSNQSNDSCHQGHSMKVSDVLRITNNASVNMASHSDKGKSPFIFRPLSGTTRENDLGRITPVSSEGAKMPAPWERGDDFIPDAAGNVHMKSGVIKKKDVPCSQSVIGTIGCMGDSRDSSESHVYLQGQNVRQLDSPLQSAVQTFQQNTDSVERFIISPSCQKLIGQLGVTLQTDRLLGQPINTHFNINQNSTVSQKQVLSCDVAVPNVVDLHLMRESSCDTNSELEQIYDSVHKKQEQQVHGKDQNAVIRHEDSEISSGCSDIDVEGDWDNPWKNVSQDSTLVQNSLCGSTLNSTEIERNLTDPATPKKVSSTSVQSKSNNIDTAAKVFGNFNDKTNKNKNDLRKTPSKETPHSVNSRFLMSPPKKRITASMKCGGGLYFVSTSNNGAKTSKDTHGKRTPKKVSVLSDAVRRSPRIAASPGKGKGKVAEGSVDKVKRNLCISEGDKPVKPGCKRPREESEHDKEEDVKSKVRKVKTPVDLTSLNVDKFLTKLYKK